MPFRLWLYLTKVYGVGLFAVIFATFFAPNDSALGHARSAALFILIPLCLIGALMGILMAFGKLRMLCPFCGRSGPAGASKQDGMWMKCESCGLIHSSGPLGLKIVKEKIGEDAS
jgi:hypothetical protein